MGAAWAGRGGQDLGRHGRGRRRAALAARDLGQRPLTRPGTTGPPAFWRRATGGGQAIDSGAEPPLERGGGTGRNAVPGYGFPPYEVVNHLLSEMPLRTSALRSLGAHLNVFAIESFMDELAAARRRRPDRVPARATCADPRGRAVLRSRGARANWADWAPADSIGHGIGYARYKNSSAYCAVVAEVEAVAARCECAG